MLALRIKKAVRKGATLVVADPRKIWLTKLAKRHLQLRPGTDVWLLNAMMHTILEEGLQNEEYIRETTDDFEAVREIVMRYSPEEAEKITGVPAEDIRATAREYASEKHAGIFYTLGITEHACGVDNIWSLSNLVLMTGHLGYESTGLNALRGQNNVQGLNDSGANPVVPPRLPVRRRPRDPAEVRGAMGRRGSGAPRLPPRPDRLRPARRADQGALPDRREPGADRAERAPRRGGPRGPRLHDVAGHLPERLDAQVRARRPPRLELRREGRDVHEHGAAHQPRPRRRAAAGRGARRPRDRHRDGEGARRELARVPGRGVGLERARRSLAELERDPLRPDRGERHAVAVHRPRPSRHAVPARARSPRCRAAAAASSRSSSSRRSRSPTPSTRSCSRPAARSTTTTRRT